MHDVLHSRVALDISDSVRSPAAGADLGLPQQGLAAVFSLSASR